MDKYINNTIRGNNIKIEPYRRCDFDDYYNYLNNKKLLEKLCLLINSREDEKLVFVLLMTKREFIKLSLLNDDKAIHPTNLNYEKEDGMEEFKDKFGINLSFAISRKHRNKGYMTEALNLVV